MLNIYRKEQKMVYVSKILLMVLISSGALILQSLSWAADSEEKAQPANPVVLMKTSEGLIRIELWPGTAPETVKNFLQYVDEGFYDGTIFHRVIGNFMIQGGGFTPDMNQKPTHAPVKNEASAELKNDRGTIAMARTMVVDSATGQFFINVVDNVSLNHRDESPAGFGYAVFGKVIDGMDVVDKIKGVATSNSGQFQNVPEKPVVIESLKRE
jgi:cyclophilin family peptidyl-prolyl cis-trans isomerase